MSRIRFSRPLFTLAGVALAASAGLLLLFQAPGPAPETPARARLLGALRQESSGRQATPPLPAAAPEVALPSLISLADVPADSPHEGNMYLRWQRGEIDLDRELGLVPEVEVLALQEAALRLEPNPALPDAGLASPAAGPVVVTTFDGPDITDCCGGSGAAVPPDPDMAVGPNHVLVAVNESLAVYSRSGGTIVAPVPFAALFNGVDGCYGSNTALFDPNVLYDEEAGRFVAAIDGDGAYYCIAVTQSGDPTAIWIRYRFTTGTGAYFDFPQAGIGDHAIFMGGNMFSATYPYGFLESRVWAFDKAAMYAAQAAQSRVQLLPSIDDTPQPVSLHGYAQGQWPAGAPHAIITETGFNGRDYSLYNWSDPFGANQLWKASTFNLNAATGMTAGFPVDVPQYAAGTLQANDWRPLDAEYQGGTIWTTNTVSCNPGGGTVDCIRWAQISAANGAVIQSGVVASPGRYRFFGDLAVNSCGDMAVGYTRVDPATPNGGYPSVWVAGRQAADPPGVLSAEQPLRQSSTYYTAFDSAPRRWGDYTNFTADPNGLDLWYIGQYSKITGTSNGRWATVVGHLTFNNLFDAPAAFEGLDLRLFLPVILRGGSQSC